MWNSYLLRVKDFIESRQLLQRNRFYIVALSGGSDSVALLCMMRELGYRIVAAHCNFQLRGEEAYNDERFCETLCAQFNIPFHRIHFDTQTYSQLHHVSIEMAARELRYQYFENLREDVAAEGILVGHHQDDSVETILMNFIRGTGIDGLLGIQAKKGRIIRPLLCLTQNEIYDYLSTKRQAYVLDQSNLIDNVVRNRIRLNIIPLLQEINSSASQNIIATSKRLSQVSELFHQAILQNIEAVTKEKTDDATLLDLEQLQHLTAQEYTLFYLLRNFNFSPETIAQISLHLNASTGKRWLSKTHVASINRSYLMIEKRCVADLQQSLVIPEEGNYIWNANLKFTFAQQLISPTFQPSRAANEATLDADKVRFPLKIRYARQGDRFTPFGMQGSKLLSDFLTEKKFSLNKKQQQLVIEDSAGTLVWIVGLRTSQCACINYQTRKVLRICCIHAD